MLRWAFRHTMHAAISMVIAVAVAVVMLMWLNPLPPHLLAQPPEQLAGSVLSGDIIDPSAILWTALGSQAAGFTYLGFVYLRRRARDSGGDEATGPS